MKRVILLLLVVSLAGIFPLLAQNDNSQGDEQGNGAVLIPGSSIENPGDQGKISHTNHVIFFRGGAQGATPSGLSPLQIATAYGLVPNNWPYVGSRTIAIVDAYDYPTAANDLTAFSSKLNLPPCTVASGCFKVVYVTSNGKAPRANCGWAQEAALDIEWAHAMAPNAKIVLVEAASNSNADLFAAVNVATNIVVAGSGGEVSMSWGGSESSSETQYEKYFNGNHGVVYFASSGDTGGRTIYPGTSPNVVSAGGTTLKLTSTNTILSETGWSGSGGGTSPYFPVPGYQNVIGSIVGSQRGVPDFSFDADPYTGVSVYDTTSCQGMSGWMVFGGTSVASPSLAGIVNAAGAFSASTNAELSTIYLHLGASHFNDIVGGTAGKYSAVKGWDFVTGVGSNNGLNGK